MKDPPAAASRCLRCGRSPVVLVCPCAAAETEACRLEAPVRDSPDARARVGRSRSATRAGDARGPPPSPLGLGVVAASPVTPCSTNLAWPSVRDCYPSRWMTDHFVGLVALRAGGGEVLCLSITALCSVQSSELKLYVPSQCHTPCASTVTLALPWNVLNAPVPPSNITVP